MSLLIVFLLFVTVTSIAPQSTPEKHFQERIVGGYPIEIEKAPYQLSLRVVDDSEIYNCGAVLVSARFALTAAHCTQSEGKYFIGYGSKNLSKENNMEVDEIFVHPLNVDYDYDIAVLSLSEPLTFSSKVQPVKLPGYGEEAEAGEMMLVSGWGLTRETPGLATELQATEVPLIEWPVCRRIYSKDPYIHVTTRMLCAGFFLGGKDACNGDSGGPLVRASDKVLFGLVSWGVGCALPQHPGFYTNIAYFREWIREVTGV